MSYLLRYGVNTPPLEGANIPSRLQRGIKRNKIKASKQKEDFLVQSTPKMSATQIITMIKNITAREIFKGCPEVKKKLWGGQFWTDGFYVSTVGQHGNEDVIRKYVQNQGAEKEYKSLLVQQLSMFE